MLGQEASKEGADDPLLSMPFPFFLEASTCRRHRLLVLCHGAGGLRAGLSHYMLISHIFSCPSCVSTSDSTAKYCKQALSLFLLGSSFSAIIIAIRTGPHAPGALSCPCRCWGGPSQTHGSVSPLQAALAAPHSFSSLALTRPLGEAAFATVASPMITDFYPGPVLRESEVKTTKSTSVHWHAVSRSESPKDNYSCYVNG